MAEGGKETPVPDRRSSSAEAAALRWAETHPEDEVEPVPPSVPGQAAGAASGHSASAEAAALRLAEQDQDDSRT